MIDKDNMTDQLLYNIYMLLAYGNTQRKEEEPRPDTPSPHWKHLSKALDVLFIIMFSVVFMAVQISLIIIIYCIP